MCATRSLESVVQRILQKLNPLKVYFQVMVTSNDAVIKSKAEAILQTLKNPVTEVFFEFLGYILPLINRLNRLFQSENSQIYVLQIEVNRLVSQILNSFMHKSHMDNFRDKMQDIRYNDPRFYLPIENNYISALKVNSLLKNVSAIDNNFVRTKCLC